MKQTIWKVFRTLILVLLLGSEAYAAVAVIKADLLPTKYLALLFGAMVVVTLVILLLIMGPKKGKYQKSGGTGRKIIAVILAVIVSAGCIVAANAVSKVNETVEAITQTTVVSSILDVYVMNDDAAQSIADAGSYTFAITESYDYENTKKAVVQIEAELGASISTSAYPSVFTMIDALYAGEVDAVIVNTAYVAILDEFEGYTDFAEKARLLCEYEITETVEVEVPETNPADEATQGAEETAAPVVEEDEEPDYTKPFVMYLSGSDTRSRVLKKSRSDVNILAIVNPQTKQVLLLNTPRDYYVVNPVAGTTDASSYDKLTHCGLYGPECSMEALGNLYDEKITYYAQINFTGFETLIDAVGGVTVHSDVSFKTTNKVIQKGDNQLDGAQALAFARTRYGLSGGDNDRGKNQMKIIAAVIEKFSAGTIISKYSEIMDALQGMFTTNVSQEMISELVKMQLSDMSSWNVVSYAVTGTGDSAKNYSAPGVYAYVMRPHEDTVALATELIDRVMNGETLSAEDLVLSK